MGEAWKVVAKFGLTFEHIWLRLGVDSNHLADELVELGVGLT